MRLRARHRLTGRALVLGAALVLLVVVLAAPVHRYLSARSGVSQAAVQQAQDQKQVAQLQQQLKQWDDPAYVEQQARQRLQFALPGETTYVVITPGKPSNTKGATPTDTSAATLPGQTWNQRLWGSLQAADSAP